MEFVYPTPNPNFSSDEFEESEIQNYFKGSTILVTGATGFLGALLVEKLLRSCPEVGRIYVLIRAKKGVSSEERFLNYFQKPIFEEALKKFPKAKEKVAILVGDCALPDLGLGDEDRKIIVEEVDSIIHLAATVRFDEKLKTAAHINVRATRDLLKLAQGAKKLSSIVYVSTAFSNCPNQHIEETFYEPGLTGNELLAMVDLLSERIIEELTPTIIGKWPNTYAFTKSIAEDVVRTEGKNLPIAICRPAIIIATVSEPIPGWIDNFYGAAGVFAGTGLGLIRSMYCKRNNVAEMVPADYVVNNIIAAAWSAAQTKNHNALTTEVSDRDIPIYNYVSGSQNPITWGESMDLGFHYGTKTPSVMEIWHPFLFLIPNKYLQLIFHYLLHIFPAYLIDFFAFCFGKRPGLRKAYKKISKFLNAIEYFSSRQWRIDNENTQKLWLKLNRRDKDLFEFNIESVNWDSYFRSFFRGIRLYVIKDPLETVPQGLSKFKRIRIAHYCILTIITLGFIRFILWIFSVVL